MFFWNSLCSELFLLRILWAGGEWQVSLGLPGPDHGWLRQRRRAERNYCMFKVRRGGCEEVSLVQDEEQRLQFAGAAVKRYPTSKVKETQVRW